MLAAEAGAAAWCGRCGGWAATFNLAARGRQMLAAEAGAATVSPKKSLPVPVLCIILMVNSHEIPALVVSAGILYYVSNKS